MVDLVWCMPDAYQKLFIDLINTQLALGVCPTTMCDVGLSQLPKPDGGFRGLCIGEDAIKVVTALISVRLAWIQRGLRPGEILTDLNMAYSTGHGTEEIHLQLDYASCRARVEATFLMLLEYDLYKYFDQMDRRFLIMLLFLIGFPMSVTACFYRRYSVQRIKSDTLCGTTTGFSRGPYGIDQGGVDSPHNSALYQTAFLVTLSVMLSQAGGSSVCGFADNHYIHWMADVPTPFPWDRLSNLLRFSCMVVKPTSVKVRLVNQGDMESSQLGTLKTTDHITGEAVSVVPHVVGVEECPRVLGVPFSGQCSFTASQASLRSGMFYRLHSCVARNFNFAFLEILLRASLYSWAQYGSAFRVLDWNSINQATELLRCYRCKRLGFLARYSPLVACLPVSQGGMNLTVFHLESFVIPWVRSGVHLFNLESTLGVSVRQFVITPSEIRLQTSGGKLQVEAMMKQLAPMGILFISNRYQIIGRALSVLQIHLATIDKKYYHLVPLHLCPTPDQVSAHSIFVLGGALHCIMVANWTRLKAVLVRLDPLCGVILGRIPSYHARLALQDILETGATGLGGHQLGNFRYMNIVADALVEAVYESDYDFHLQASAAGLVVDGKRRVWPDWGDEVTDPMIEHLDAFTIPDRVAACRRTG